jgi:MFS family permease
VSYHMPAMQRQRWLTRDAFLLSLSAFFADLGYQAVTAVFPLFLVQDLRQSAVVYGLVTGVSFGIGSVFAFLGGKAADRFSKKTLSILGNAFIPLMSLSGLFLGVWPASMLYILGWWARYFRTPPRRALLVEVSPAEHQSKVFGFLHAMDIGGGMLAVCWAIALLFLRVPTGTIMALTAFPLFLSTAVLFFVREEVVYSGSEEASRSKPRELSAAAKRNRGIFLALLAAATLYGFSFYNLGFPILTAAESAHSQTRGVITYAVYLGVSAIAGYLLGSARFRPLRALWQFGYLPSSIASLGIGLAYVFRLATPSYYGAVAVLGAGMGAVETYEPTLVSALAGTSDLSTRMGWLSVSRAIGQFLSNVIMGFLFTLGQFNSYIYAFITASLATLVMWRAEANTRSAVQARHRGD